MIETEAKRPRVLLAAVDTGAYDAEQSLDELEELADTAGADTAARIVKQRPVKVKGNNFIFQAYQTFPIL